jgi:hypothetical protein
LAASRLLFDHRHQSERIAHSRPPTAGKRIRLTDAVRHAGGFTRPASCLGDSLAHGAAVPHLAITKDSLSFRLVAYLRVGARPPVGLGAAGLHVLSSIHIRSGSKQFESGNRAGERYGALSDSCSMCGTRVPKIISRNQSPPDAWAPLVFGSWCTLKRRSPVSKPSGATDFLAFIPQQIDPSSHESWGPKLAGFPFHLVYTKARNGIGPTNLELKNSSLLARPGHVPRRFRSQRNVLSHETSERLPWSGDLQQEVRELADGKVPGRYLDLLRGGGNV